MKCFKKNFTKKKVQIIIVAGPTASGKSDLAVDLALAFGGEVISADSRQVYQGLDIGSAKITSKEMRGVPHHMLDVADPKEVFTVAQYKHQAGNILKDIIEQGKVPIICGGTGFYIDALIYEQNFPEVPPNQKLRKELEQKDFSELYRVLQKKDPRRASKLDPQNKVRLIRALEIVDALGKVPKPKKRSSRYDLLYICLEQDRDIHFQNIDKRIESRMKQGMLQEVENLNQKAISWQRLEDLGLEYRYLAQHLQRKITKQEAKTLISKESKKFIKRQYTWFRKNPDVKWFDPSTQTAEIFEEVRKFLPQVS